MTINEIIERAIADNVSPRHSYAQVFRACRRAVRESLELAANIADDDGVWDAPRAIRALAAKLEAKS